jgi:hypothetical protein
LAFCRYSMDIFIPFLTFEPIKFYSAFTTFNI